MNELNIPSSAKALIELNKQLDPNSIMSQTIESISKFNDNIYKIKELNKPLGTITKDSPLEETNERLANIEKGFEDLQEIATESAKIQNLLNASAAEFLVKFEKASMDNQRSARVAIILATLAVIATIISPFLPNLAQ